MDGSVIFIAACVAFAVVFGWDTIEDWMWVRKMQRLGDI